MNDSWYKSFHKEQEAKRRKRSLQANGKPSLYPVGRSSVNFTEGEIKDIVRRMRNFENPISIANFYGTTRRTIMDTFKKATK